MLAVLLKNIVEDTLEAKVVYYSLIHYIRDCNFSIDSEINSEIEINLGDSLA